ncbi:hypothetical protein GCM10011506_44820 [Marivirga lumbricoides]|uniref:Uncharacterized protein n=1 Tax=Marivirga lumbricoides TaxID=1046115 RepID=A0ABQ1N507_9BACT|nr:hypothetical protein GCM10011506_44820 [Marivirga lumbricoides]
MYKHALNNDSLMFFYIVMPSCLYNSVESSYYKVHDNFLVQLFYHQYYQFEKETYSIIDKYYCQM